MFLRLLFLLTFIPLMEIYFLLKISKIIGGTNTLILILITGFLGAWLLRFPKSQHFFGFANKSSPQTTTF